MTQTDRNALLTVLDRQKASYLAGGFPDAMLRRDRLRRLAAVITDNLPALCAAADADFSGRPAMQSKFELAAALGTIRHAIAHLEQWMRPDPATLPEMQHDGGARAEVFYQPLGAIGVVSPWNFPFFLSIGAMAGMLAAGNRVMLKPSELNPSVSPLLKSLLDAAFSEEEVATVLGGQDVGQTFVTLPFDHLLFTGSPIVAKHVMAAAAANLVPVTLELGGKCPAIIGPDADWDVAVDRILAGKIQNAGQICLAPDYALVPEGSVDRLVAAAQDKIAQWYPTVGDNPDYCAIINERHYDRLQNYLVEAERRGVRIVPLAPQPQRIEDRRIPPTLILDAPEDLTVMQEEIFGPLLPVRTYASLDDAIAFVNRRPRPLALYYFGNAEADFEKIKHRTTSGGVTFNDYAAHAACEALPLGGIGNSGMGAYHGEFGFRTFSHAKAIFAQGNPNPAMFFNPPYSDTQGGAIGQVFGTAGAG